MKKAEITDEWQDVLIPARVKASDELWGEDYMVRVQPYTPNRQYACGPIPEPHDAEGRFECPAYRHFTLIPKGFKAEIKLVKKAK